MKNKYFYPIFKLKAKSWIRYWLLKKTEFKGKLSEILTGFSFNLQNTLRQKFVKFEIEGHSEQESTEGYNVMNIKDLTEVTSNGITFTPVYNSNGSLKYINVNGTATRDVTYPLMTGKTIAAGTYHLSGCPTGGSTSSYYIYTRPANAHDTGNGCNITYDEDTIMTANNMRITIISGTTVSNQKWYPMLVSGTEEKAYEPYTGGQASPNPSYEQPIKSAGENGSITDKITNADGTEEQTYSIPVQAPFRSIGDVRDCFVKKSDGWYERHLPYISSYNGEELPQDVYTESGGIKYCNSKSMSTTGQFSTGASVQYIDESNWNDIPCTQAQINILENIPSTFSGQTNVYSTDEVQPYLKIQYWESDENA